MVKKIKVSRHIRNGIIVDSHVRVIDESSLTKEIKRNLEDKKQSSVLFPNKGK